MKKDNLKDSPKEVSESPNQRFRDIKELLNVLDNKIDKTKLSHYDNLMLREKIKEEQDKEKELQWKKSKHMFTTISGIMVFMVLIAVAFANVIMFSHVVFLGNNSITSLYLLGNIFVAICLVILYAGFMFAQDEKNKKRAYD